jgi:predicted RNA-binding Zn-ribbon protein involved in translation (DUF1610 family)
MVMSVEEWKAQVRTAADQAIEDMLAKKPASEQITLSDIERLVLEAQEKIGTAVLAGMVEQAAGRAVEVCPECGGKLQYRGQRTRRVVTEAGAVEVERAYYSCSACGQMLFPPGSAVGFKRECV